MATKANRRAVTRRDTMPARAVLVTDPKGKASQMANNVSIADGVDTMRETAGNSRCVQFPRAMLDTHLK